MLRKEEKFTAMTLEISNVILAAGYFTSKNPKMTRH
jgi:hypothetical protein